MQIELVLLALSVDWPTGSYYVLSKDEGSLKPPTTDCINAHLLDNDIRRLMKDNTGLSPSWARAKLQEAGPSQVSHCDLSLFYSVVIPYDTEVKGHWIPLNMVDLPASPYGLTIGNAVQGIG